MKRTVCLLLSALVLGISAITASAKTVGHKIGGVSFELDDSFSVFTSDNLSESSTVEGLVAAIMSGDGSQQIQIRSTETDFSLEMESFKGLSAESIASVGQKLFKNGYSTVELKSNVYLKQSSVEDGKYSVIYVTVADKKLYTFTYFGTDPTLIGEFMASVKLNDTRASDGSNVLMTVILSVLIAAFAVAAGMIILSFVKDYRRRKMEQSENVVSNYIKIKRRKY